VEKIEAAVGKEEEKGRPSRLYSCDKRVEECVSSKKQANSDKLREVIRGDVHSLRDIILAGERFIH
jgi:predicted transcriptional regulator